MPQDLSTENRATPPGHIQLTESPNSNMSPEASHEQTEALVLRERSETEEHPGGNLHPYTTPLTISDSESCVALEEAAFTKAEERCSREKFEYRLTKCGDLCLGLFASVSPNSNVPAETFKTGRPVESDREDGAVGVLLAHIVATRSTGPVVTDADMDYPREWKTSKAASNVGHQEEGRTICLHSFGVLPKYQKRGVGRILLMAYLQQMNSAGIADRVSLIAHDHLVPYYEKYGFQNKGSSKVQFGGGGWYDMVFELKAVEARATYG